MERPKNDNNQKKSLRSFQEKLERPNNQNNFFCVFQRKGEKDQIIRSRNTVRSLLIVKGNTFINWLGVNILCQGIALFLKGTCYAFKVSTRKIQHGKSV